MDNGPQIPQPAPAPNAWTVIDNYTTSILTLASALLTLTFTFADKILVPNAPAWSRFSLGAAWILLLATLFSGAQSKGWLSDYLRISEADRCESARKKCLGFAQLTLWCLFFAIVGLLICAVPRVIETSSTLDSACMKTARILPAITNLPDSRWIIVEAKAIPGDKSFELLARDDASKTEYRIQVSAQSGDIVKFGRSSP